MKFPVRTALLSTGLTATWPAATKLIAMAFITAAICSGAAMAGEQAAVPGQYDTAMKITPLKLAMGPVSAPQKPGGTGGVVESTGCDGSCPIRHKTIKHRRH